ncbi:MAG TPA: endo-1,4-beta-xylanase [Steroidobacteraceae bacterium]|jgi:endo-1,4-beta-xylanase|nr:endo-1,4-beta-xylanase [Steroidobacteraceae bacterium]
MNLMNSRLIAAAAAGAFALAGAATAVAAPNPSSDSLRDLAAQVQLRLGTAATPLDLSDPTLSQITAGQFSVLTPENEMKWQVVEPQQGAFNWTGADNLVHFAEAHGQRVRGHTLVWHNQLPNWLTQGVAGGTISDAQLRDLLRQHITTEVRRYRGRIWQWDVVNEMLTDSNPSQINPNDFWVSHLGTGVIADAFRWAKAADPRAVLCYNDYNIAGEDGSNAKFEAAFSMVQTFLAQGVPIDCVGDQGHLDLQYGFNPDLMTQDLRQYASLGLKVAITEADVRTFVETTDSKQTPIVSPTDSTPSHTANPAAADWYNGMLQSCLAVQACISFTVWGFDDSESWVPATFHGEGDADLYDVNLNPKPQYTAVQQTLSLAAGAPNRLGPNEGD